MLDVEQEYARAFICIPVSAQTRKSLSHINSHVRTEASGLSCPKPEHAHITLAFLGKISGDTAQRISTGMDSVCRNMSSFKYKLDEAGIFGSRKSPRVLWVGVQNAPGLMNLQGQIAGIVRNAGVALEARPFKPHLTIARIRSSLPPGSLTSIISCINNTHFAEIMVDHVLFMNSRLNGPGPRFTTIHQSLLKGS